MSLLPYENGWVDVLDTRNYNEIIEEVLLEIGRELTNKPKSTNRNVKLYRSEILNMLQLKPIHELKLNNNVIWYLVQHRRFKDDGYHITMLQSKPYLFYFLIKFS